MGHPIDRCIIRLSVDWIIPYLVADSFCINTSSVVLIRFCQSDEYLPRVKPSTILTTVDAYSAECFGNVPGPKISIFLTLPNSDSGCALPEVPMGRKNVVPLQWHGNTFVTFQRFHINTITT